MSTTPHLGLPYLAVAQAQKHVTHNEALRALDALVQIAVIDRSLAAPPGSPAEGDRYIVAAAATGAWSGHDGKLAAFQDGAWMLYPPQEGFLAWVADEGALVVFDGAGWIPAAETIAALPLLGINMAADATNRLSVASAAALFSHAGNGHQLKVNKAAAGDTAALLFQTGFSGRSEFGLTGDDDTHLKVSANGTAWVEALKLTKDTGAATFSASVTAPGDMSARRFLATSADFEFLITPINNTHPTANSTLFEFLFNSLRRYAFGVSHASQFFTVTAYDETGTWQGSALTIEYATSATGSLNNALYVKNNRDVGIGKVPTAKLDVDGPVKVKSYAKAGVPSASAVGAGGLIYVTDAAGGAQLAYSNGTAWLKVSDNAVI